jgi:cytidylate kinase
LGVFAAAVGPAPAGARAVDAGQLDDPALRTREAGEAASRVAVHAGVRKALLAMQQAFAAQPGGAVIDGRDIGTVIAPDAAVKLYVTADPAVRAERRRRQLQAQGEAVGLAEILDDIRLRDVRDGDRDAAPMRPADNAVLLDTTDLDIDRAFDAAHRIVDEARARWEQSRG